MFFECNKVNDQQFIKNTIKDNLKIVIVLGFLINLYVFDLCVELFLVPVSVIIGVILAMTEKKYHIVHTFLSYIAFIFGLGLIIYALYMVVVDFKHFATLGNFENLYLPIVFTIMFLPFIYIVAVCLRYETLFLRLKFFVNDRDPSLIRYVRMKTLFAFDLNIRGLNKWSKHINTVRFKDKEGVDKAIREFKGKTTLADKT
jgi:hypothetical protein